MRLKLTLAALAVVWAPAPGAATIDFDDLVGTGPVPAGYAGLSWEGWTHYDLADQPYYEPRSPATRVYAPGPNAIIGVEPFRFEGAYFSGPPENLLRFDLYFNGNLKHSSESLSIGASYAFLDSGYRGAVDKVVVSATSPWYFVMDDVVVHSVPEPGTYAMLLGGLALVIALTRPVLTRKHR